MEEDERRRQKALAMGGPEKLERRRNAGLLNARERIDYLVDKGSFLESGLLATSYIPAERESSPADGKIAGYARIDGRETVVVATDFTVKGASSIPPTLKKIAHMQRKATARGLPLVFPGHYCGPSTPP